MSLKETALRAFDISEANPYAGRLFDDVKAYKRLDTFERRQAFEAITSGVIEDRYQEFTSLLNRFSIHPDDRSSLDQIKDTFCEKMKTAVDYFVQIRDYSDFGPFFIFEAENLETSRKLEAHYKGSHTITSSNIEITLNPYDRTMEIHDHNNELDYSDRNHASIAMNIISTEAFDLSHQMADILFDKDMSDEEKFALFTSQEDAVLDRLLNFDLQTLGKADIVRFFQYFFAQSFWQTGNIARTLALIDKLHIQVIIDKMSNMRCYMDLFERAQEDEKFKKILKLDQMQGRANAYMKYGQINIISHHQAPD